VTPILPDLSEHLVMIATNHSTKPMATQIKTAPLQQPYSQAACHSANERKRLNIEPFCSFQAEPPAARLRLWESLVRWRTPGVMRDA
jgi:hypothetical protein